MVSSVLLQAIVEVVEACMKGEGANARKHVRLRTPIHPFTLPLPHLRSQHVSAASRCWPVWLLLTSLLRDSYRESLWQIVDGDLWLGERGRAGWPNFVRHHIHHRLLHHHHDYLLVYLRVLRLSEVPC